MRTELVLIAHAATAATQRSAFARDEDLSPRGRAAIATAVPAGPGRLLVSPALAARQTATALAPGRAASVEPELRDLDVGRWAGRTLLEVGEEAARWVADPEFKDHGGESLAAFAGRVDAWLAAGLAHAGRTVGVTHGAVLRAALLAVLGAEPAAFWRIDVPPLGRLVLTSDGRRWALRALQP